MRKKENKHEYIKNQFEEYILENADELWEILSITYKIN